MVPIIEAKVEGLPIPFSSSAFTNDASVYLAGGLVLCDSESKELHLIFSFFESEGRTLSLFSRSLSGLSRPST